MSTGDQTQYVRSKIAERGSERGEHFMMDGFDRWAESSAPARAGQMEKTPAESQMESYGGAMTLSKAKRLQSMMSKHGGAIGGASISVGGIQIPIPEFIDKGIKAAKDLIKVVEWTLNFVDEFAEDFGSLECEMYKTVKEEHPWWGNPDPSTCDWFEIGKKEIKFHKHKSVWEKSLLWEQSNDNKEKTGPKWKPKVIDGGYCCW